jgi:hypothetical protein
MLKKPKKIAASYSPKPRKAAVRSAHETLADSPKPATPSPFGVAATTTITRSKRDGRRGKSG